MQKNIETISSNKNQLFRSNELLRVLNSRFSFQNFRTGQLEAIESLLQQGRLLCVQPTGHGKSLLYQLPSILLNGVTVVISPLLALMRDQLEHLNKRFQIPAASINSDQTEEENAQTCRRLLKNEIKILFIAPEQLGNLQQFRFLSRLPIDLIVVDEAHCISTWGHDFRPEYREILNFIVEIESKNPTVKILGLTATADHRTEQDIKQQLSSQGKEVVVNRESMNRPNIALSILPAANREEKLALSEKLVSDFLDNARFKHPITGLIYCATRENTELVADYLKTIGINAEYYHAGLKPEKKKQLQQDFILDQYSVLVATNALGMGIDKQNLRFIIHYDFPGSITAYYQEVGRCGRDGASASGVLLYCPQDERIQKYFINAALPDREDFNKVLSVVNKKNLNLTSIKTQTGLHPTRVTVVTSELVQQGFLRKASLDGKQVYQLTKHSGKPELSRYQILFENKMDELNKMLHYCHQTTSCRMLLLRHHLGEPGANENCGQCDICKKLPPPLIEAAKLNDISIWQETRLVPIHLSNGYNMIEGFSLLEGSARSSLFIRFMKSRASIDDSPIQQKLLEKILQLLEQKIKASRDFPISCVVVIPSRTWRARNRLATELAKRLQIPCFLEALRWEKLPTARQGEFLNNDQRRENVNNKMRFSHLLTTSAGTLLLLDDYMGSGATLKEAVRAIRQTGVKQKIIPVTIAAVKWKLGQRGIV